MKFPKLILIKDLLAPVSISRNRVSEISAKIHSQDLDDLDRHGLFVLAIASLESMMNDIVLYLLQAIPEKLDFKECKVTKNDLIGTSFTHDIIVRQCEKEVMGASYENIYTFIDYFCKVTAIKDGFSQDKLNSLREIKESRNLLRKRRGWGQFFRCDKAAFSISVPHKFPGISINIDLSASVASTLL